MRPQRRFALILAFGILGGCERSEPVVSKETAQDGQAFSEKMKRDIAEANSQPGVTPVNKKTGRK